MNQKIRWMKLADLDDYAFAKAHKKVIEDLRRSPIFVSAYSADTKAPADFKSAAY